MANKNIKGITIEIGGNTTKLQDALKKVNGIVQDSNAELKRLDQALKLDPKNTDLLAQKQDVLKNNIKATVEKLEQLKEAQRQMGDYSKLTEEQKEQYRYLSTEIVKSENALKGMNAQLDESNKSDLSGITNEADKVGKSFIKVGDIIKANLASEAIIRVFDSIAGKIKDISSQVSNLVIQGGIDRALNLENAKAKMSTFTESTEQLDKIMQNVQDSVDGTAFSMDSAATVAAGLFAAGIKEGPQMESALRLVGDAAQVSGRSMEDIGSIFNKVAANGKLSGEELNQLADSGIPVLQLLSKSLGKSTEEVRDMVSAGKIGFQEFSDAMEQGLGGAAQNAGATFTSSLANLKSAFARMGAEIMTPLLEGVTPVMNTFKDLIKNMVAGNDISETMNQLFVQIQEFATTAAEHLTEMSDKYIPVISQMLNSILQMIPQLLPQIIPLITSLIQNITNLILQNLPTLVNTVLQVGLQLVIAIAQMLPTLLPQIIDCIIQIANTLIDNIDLIIDAGIQLLLGLIEGLTEAIPQLVDMLPTIITKIVTTLIDHLPEIIEGGIKILNALIEGLIECLPSLIMYVPKIVVAMVKALIEGLPKILEAGGSLIAGLIDGIGGKITAVKNAAKQIFDTIKNTLKDLPSKAIQWGKDMLQGLADGIKGAIGKVTSAVKGVADKIKNFLHFSRPDEGPLREYEKWMPDFMKGLAKGIDKSSYLVEDATQNLADKMANTLSVDNMVNDLDGALKGLNGKVATSVNPQINPNVTYESNYKMMAKAVREALEDMAVELDEDKVGRFIIKKVSNEVYN